MDPAALQLLQRSFQSHAMQDRSAVRAAICAGVGAGPSDSLVELYDRFFRIASAIRPDPIPLLAGLHWLALRHEAPSLAAYFPSCGGVFTPADTASLAEAAKAVIANQRDDLLDFMLGEEPATPGVRPSAPLLLGALATTDRFDGGLAVVEIGSGTGLTLNFDHYAYQFGTLQIGASPVKIVMDVTTGSAGVARLLQLAVPNVVARYGVDPHPRYPGDRDAAQLIEAFLPPDAAQTIDQFRLAVATTAETVLDVREGFAETDLLGLLIDAYRAMPPHNTLLVYQNDLWPDLSDGARQATTLAVQRIASQLAPHKPMAWLQVERFTTAPNQLEVRLQTFGWADPEDRAVRKLAAVNASFTSIRWLEP